MDLVFAVISDTHIKGSCSAEHEKLKRALIYINSIESDLDALIVAGDITNMGTKKSFEGFVKIFKSCMKEESQKILVMGNHDYLGSFTVRGAQKKFVKTTGEDIHSHKIIKGFHFISLSTEGKKIKGVYGKKLLGWLKKHLKEAHADDFQKPIFITLHHNIKGTVYGSDYWGNDKLYEIIKEYPQAVVFSGHSHHPVKDERAIHQRDFTAVSAGSTSYVQLEGKGLIGGIPYNAGEFSQGLMVNVKNNCVSLSVLDFEKNVSHRDKWIIEEAANKKKFLYTDERNLYRNRPYFGRSSSVKIIERGSNHIKIEFTQGRHQDFVHSYVIRVIDKRKEKLIKETKIFSDYYSKYQSSQLQFSQKYLMPGREYVILVNAVESFGMESEDFLSVSFKTKGIFNKEMFASMFLVGKYFNLRYNINI
ncbi:MAG: metallophosphoesterase [Clostridiaceae bacterium]